MTNTQSKKKRNEKKEKSKLTSNQIKPPYMSYSKRKRIPRQIKWYDISTITTILVSLTCRPKAMKRSTCVRLASTIFFFCTKTEIPLEIYNNNKKNYYKITTNPLKSRLKFSNVKKNGIIKLFIVKYNYYISPLD
jgi:hypothetical protein